MSQTLESDVAVIGAGIIGSTIAWEACRAGLRVVRVSQPRSGSATHAAGGMLTPSAEAEGLEPSLIELACESCQRYPAFIQALENAAQQSSGYHPTGTLLLAVNRDQLSDLEHLEKFQASLGLKISRPTIRELRELEPNLTPRIAGGLYAQSEHHINPRQLQATLEQALERANTLHLSNTQTIELIEQSGNILGLEATSSDGVTTRIHARSVVAADGVWTNQIPGLEGLLPLRPIKGQYLRLRGEPLINRTVRTPDVYLVPREDGEIYIGATSEEVGFDDSLQAGATMDLLWQAWRAVPGIYELEIEEFGVGFRPALRDNLPLIDLGPLNGLIIATGHYRHGIMLAPITAQGVLDIIQDKGVPDVFKPFGWKRFEPNMEM
jgi:glycine oxidase